MPTITLSGVTKSFDDMVPAISNLDLEIGHGEFMCLLGPSGCGKSTTLRAIAGLESLTEGEILIGGRVLDSPRTGHLRPA